MGSLIMIKKIFNALFYILIIFLIITKIPGIYQRFQMQSERSPQATVVRLSGESLTFPIPNTKSILVFWATWCGPCSIELKRLNSMISKGLISPSQLIAVNIQEDPTTVTKYIDEHQFQFLVAIDTNGSLSDLYKVKGTPTIVFVDQHGKVNWMTEGLSPSLELRVKNFLEN